MNREPGRRPPWEVLEDTIWWLAVAGTVLIILGGLIMIVLSLTA